MTWNYRIAAMVLCAPASVIAQPTKPPAAPLVWKDDQLVLSATTAFAAACKPTAITGQTNAYTITLSSECLESADLKKLEIPQQVITRDDNGVYSNGTTSLKVKKVFNPAGASIDPGKVAEQGPFLLVLDDDSLVRTDSLRKEPAAIAGGRGQTCSLSGVKEGDVVVDLARKTLVQNPSRNVIGPNQGLTVYVCPDATKPVVVLWGGTRGLTAAQIPGANHGATIDSKDHKPVIPADHQPIRFAFSPRQVGTADLQLFDSDSLDAKPVMTVNLEVEPRYWGAVRFGLGTLFGQWNSYDVATRAGSRQSEVRETSSGATFELVSGFAPYVFDLRSGGRSESGGPNKHVAPFLGFGVLGLAPDKGVQGLSSFHAGLELEIAQNLSIAATFVYRRGRQLAPGYRSGSPVSAGMTVDTVTVDSWERGFAIVLNASPSFLQFATGASSSKSGAN